MKKIKNFIFSEKKLSGAIFGLLVIATFGLIFGPNVLAQFSRTDGGTTGYGYGYGYGYGSGVNDGSYRVDDGSDLTQYVYGYGFVDTYTWSYGSYGSCSVSCGGGTQTRTATCQSSVGTVANSYCGTPVTSQTCNTGSCGSSGSGGGGGYVGTAVCTSVVYGEYTDACFAGYQYRSTTSRTPANCTMTAAQEDAARKVCGVVSAPVVITGNGILNVITSGGNNTANFVALEKNLVKKINKALSKRLSGRILLQVENHGESWYVNPTDLLKYYMGRPADAFAMMRQFGLGVSEADYNSFVKKGVPARLYGRILLRVKAHGEAYYISPVSGKMSYMGRPADAFSIMRKFGLGITNADLRQIGVGEIK